MRFLVFLTAALALAAGPAHAGPVVGIAAWVGSTLAGSIGAALLNLGLGLAGSLITSALAKAKLGKQGVNVNFDVQFGDDLPLSFTLGDYVTAGKRKYIGSWGKNNRYITEVIEISSLPQPGLNAVWVDDELGTVLWGEEDDNGTGYNLGHPITNYDDDGHRMWIRWHDGTQAAADTMLVNLFSTDPDYPWSAAAVGTGKTYVVITTRYDSDTLTSYPAFMFQPAPLALYDIRKDSTNGGSGTHRWNDPSTWEPSRNPVVIAYNIIRGIYYGSEWVWGGKNLAAWRLPSAEWIVAANEAQAPVAMSDGSNEAAYRVGLEVTADMEPADVLEEIARCANLRFPEVGGRIKVVCGLPGAAVFSFTDEDVVITEGQSFKPFTPLSETYNAISATYPEPVEKWTMKDAGEYVAADLTAADGGRYLPLSVSYPAAPYGKQVQRLKRAQLRDFRRVRRHQFHLPPDAYALEPGVDMVSWTSARNGYINKLFVVEEVAKTPGMLVAVTLREVDPSDYDWSSDFEVEVTATPPKVPRPVLQTVTGFGAEPVLIHDSNGEARRVAIRVWCDGDEVGVTGMRAQVRKAGETDAVIDGVMPWRDPHSWYVHNVAQRTAYEVRGQLVSNIAPIGIWTTWQPVTTGAIYLTDDDFEDSITSLFESAGLKATYDIEDRSTPGAFVGQLAWSRADNSLYEWDGTQWIHFIARSLEGVLDETYFAAEMRPPRLVVSLPASGIGTGDLVVLLSTGRLYRWTGTAWVDQNAADQIVGQLTAAQIAAGAIGVEQLAARVMVANKVAITAFDNLVLDNQMQDLASWGTNATATWVTHNPSGGVTTAQAQCRGTFVVNPRPDNTLTSITSDWASISPGDEIFASCRIGATAAHSSRLILQFADLSGAILGAAAVAKTSMTWERISTSGVAPSGAVLVRLVLRVDDAGYAAGGSIVFSQPVMRRKGVGELIVDGTIRGTHIVVGTLTGGLLASTGIITGSAQIDGALITRGHIQTLAVDTLRIADNAVTIPVGASNSSDLRLYDTTGEVTLLSVSMVREGAPTMLWGTAQIGGYITSSIAMFRFYRDSTLIAQFPSVSGNDGAQTSASFAFRDANLGTGATTYSLRVERFTSGEYTGDPQIVNRSLMAMHVKK
ncbi:phage tail protein [Paracoccus sp. MBLB3053]|uniref:Phage tail protein n=1 Tax=Paracoccus aurantius TaxID=3073814 RepID=A0ABU2HT38_9RHOB|nr:phage tail protein [Paracoccus sp. MBLB3053]MDS9468217.1 phage tail protein [Paracoccus sp. MBLB3053]